MNVVVNVLLLLLRRRLVLMMAVAVAAVFPLVCTLRAVVVIRRCIVQKRVVVNVMINRRRWWWISHRYFRRRGRRRPLKNQRQHRVQRAAEGGEGDGEGRHLRGQEQRRDEGIAVASGRQRAGDRVLANDTVVGVDARGDKSDAVERLVLKQVPQHVFTAARDTRDRVDAGVVDKFHVLARKLNPTDRPLRPLQDTEQLVSLHLCCRQCLASASKVLSVVAAQLKKGDESATLYGRPRLANGKGPAAEHHHALLLCRVVLGPSPSSPK